MAESTAYASVSAEKLRAHRLRELAKSLIDDHAIMSAKLVLSVMDSTPDLKDRLARALLTGTPTGEFIRTTAEIARKLQDTPQ